MYICYITRTEIGGKETYCSVYQKISKDPKKLLVDAKTFCKKNYTKFMRSKNNLGREYQSKLSGWTEVKGFKKETNEFYPKHWYKHLVATIIGCYGRPQDCVEIKIYQIDEIK